MHCSQEPNVTLLYMYMDHLLFVDGCSSGQFQCDNGKCLTINHQCDNTDDCGDNSDQSGCGELM